MGGSLGSWGLLHTGSILTGMMDSAEQQLLHRPWGLGSWVPVASSCGLTDVRQPDSSGLHFIKQFSQAMKALSGGQLLQQEMAKASAEKWSQ